MTKKRVRLRALEAVDLQSRVMWLNDPVVRATLNFEFPASLARTEAWFRGATQDSSRLDLSLECVEDGALIGMCGFLNKSDRHRSAELYLTIGETRYWGRGLARAALHELMALGFEELGLHRIHLTTASGNDRARRAYESAGFRPEGVLRQAFYRRGAFEDVHIHSVLITEWEALRR